MTVDVTAIGDEIQELSPGKYFMDARRIAFLIDRPQEELVEFFKALKRRGQCVDGKWQQNPAPYNVIDIESQAEDNILNLYKQTTGNKANAHSILSEPSPGILGERCDYCLLGSSRLRSDKLRSITPTIQREMVGMIIGENRDLNSQYPKLAEERRKIWRDWADGGSNSELYDTRHLPWILMHYRQMLDITLPPGCDPTKITAGMKRAGKKEMINLLVDMFVLPQSCLDGLDRSSVRLSGSFTPQQSTRVVSILQPSAQDNDDSDEDMVVESSNETAVASRSLEVRNIRSLLEKGEYLEAGSLQIAAAIARRGGDRITANAVIEQLGGIPRSVKDFDAIKSIGASRLKPILDRINNLQKKS